MEWMEDTTGRAKSVDHALALARIDGRTRYVLCLTGWPIQDEYPNPGFIKEWLRVDSTGRVEYFNWTTRLGFWSSDNG
jgi:hypothetical protein